MPETAKQRERSILRQVYNTLGHIAVQTRRSRLLPTPNPYVQHWRMATPSSTTVGNTYLIVSIKGLMETRDTYRSSMNHGMRHTPAIYASMRFVFSRPPDQ